MSFRRTFVRSALERNDIHPALKKLWKKHYNIEGQVSQHLSPFEQNIISPMFKDGYSKVFNKVKDFLSEAGPGLGLGIAIYFWAEWDYKRQAFEHRY